MSDPMPPDDLREALDAWSSPAARPELRAELRERFLSAAGGETAEASLAAVEAELATLPEPVARRDFERRLRREFLAAAAPPLRRWTPRVLQIAALAAAAVLLLALIPRILGPWSLTPSSWNAVAFDAASDLVVAGRPVAHLDDATLVDSFEQGDCQLSVDGGLLCVVHPERGVMLEFPAGSEISLPARSSEEPGLIEVELASGGLRVSTTETFRGRILVHTPDGSFELEGELLGVDVAASGTCLCVEEGAARFASVDGAEPQRVGRASTFFVERGVGARFLDGVHHASELSDFASRRDLYL